MNLKKRRFGFGKYNGQIVTEVIQCDPDYVNWVVRNIPAFKLTNEENDALKEINDIIEDIEGYDYLANNNYDWEANEAYDDDQDGVDWCHPDNWA